MNIDLRFKRKNEVKKKELTAKATIAEERARKPYLAMPSERPTKVLAMPNIIL